LCPHTYHHVEIFQWILTGRRYFNTPPLRTFENFRTLFHQRGGVFRAPTPLVSLKTSTGFSRGVSFCAPKAPHQRDILLSSRAIFMALSKDIHEYFVFDMPSLLLSVETWFRLSRGCCDGRVKNCIFRKCLFEATRVTRVLDMYRELFYSK